MKLNIGCGYKRYDGFINVDQDINCNPDIICNIDCDPWPFDDNSVDEIKAHHILEHLGEGYFHTMREMYRVCKPGALIDIVVPHYRHDVFMNDPTHRRPITVEGLRMFSKSFNKWCISTNDGTTTLGLIHNVDFDVVSYDFSFDGFYAPLLQSNRPEDRLKLEQLSREVNNIIVEIHVVLAVIKD